MDNFDDDGQISISLEALQDLLTTGNTYKVKKGIPKGHKIVGGGFDSRVNVFSIFFDKPCPDVIELETY